MLRIESWSLLTTQRLAFFILVRGSKAIATGSRVQRKSSQLTSQRRALSEVFRTPHSNTSNCPREVRPSIRRRPQISPAECLRPQPDVLGVSLSLCICMVASVSQSQTDSEALVLACRHNHHEKVLGLLYYNRRLSIGYMHGLRRINKLLARFAILQS